MSKTRNRGVFAPGAPYHVAFCRPTSDVRGSETWHMQEVFSYLSIEQVDTLLMLCRCASSATHNSVKETRSLDHMCSAVEQLLRQKFYCSVFAAAAAAAAAVVFANYLVLDLLPDMCAAALRGRAVISVAAAPQYCIAASASAATATVVVASATASAPVLQCCRLGRLI